MAVAYLRSPKFVLAGGLALLVVSVSSASASSANISRSYDASTVITSGSLVSLDSGHSSAVIPANTSNGSRLVGIAIDSTDSLLAVNAGTGKLQVATNGTASVLVSNVNGDINVGDQVSVSPFNGVGAKAVAGGQVIGLAQTAFNQHSSGAQRQTVTSRSGHVDTIYVGFIRLNIGIGTASTTGTAQNVNALQRLGRSLTGHTVSTARIVISLVIALLAIVAIITLTYASIFSGIISIGRNPLAKSSILRTLLVVFGLAAVMAILASGAIYLILR